VRWLEANGYAMLRIRSAPVVVTFSDGGEETAVAQLLAEWSRMMNQLRNRHKINEGVPARYSTREMTRRQCVVFDGVLARLSSGCAMISVLDRITAPR
jgi:hypothetical protein